MNVFSVIDRKIINTIDAFVDLVNSWYPYTMKKLAFEISVALGFLMCIWIYSQNMSWVYYLVPGLLVTLLLSPLLRELPPRYSGHSTYRRGVSSALTALLIVSPPYNNDEFVVPALLLIWLWSYVVTLGEDDSDEGKRRKTDNEALPWAAGIFDSIPVAA